ncbi:uncharacterized protein C6orf47 homolog [Ambystoma mexicanum]|uniref:uncharacterized protein C6orf47 homolog n=1 Tax=Ambystoma mexicanum TaxID=8296 RepID=UPI0037E82E00
MFSSKAWAWPLPDLLSKVLWWRRSPPKKEEGDEGSVKEETLPLEAPSPGKTWLRWNFQAPAVLGYLKWWGRSDSGAGAPITEKIYSESQTLPPVYFGVQEIAAEGRQWGFRKSTSPTSDLETPEHYQICFNFIRHLVDLSVISFLWLSSPVFRLCLDILGLRGLVKLWLHGMAMFLVASYGLHVVFWLVQEYLLQFAFLFGLLQVLVLSVSIQAGLEVEEEDHDGDATDGRFVMGGDRDPDRDTPEPVPPPHLPEKPSSLHRKNE